MAKGRPTQQAKYLKQINDLITASSDSTAFMVSLQEDGGILAASLSHFEQKIKTLEQATALSGALTIGVQDDRTTHLRCERQKTMVVLQRLRVFGPALRALHAKEFLPMVVVAVFSEQLRVHGHVFPMDAYTKAINRAIVQAFNEAVEDTTNDFSQYAGLLVIDAPEQSDEIPALWQIQTFYTEAAPIYEAHAQQKEGQRETHKLAALAASDINAAELSTFKIMMRPISEDLKSFRKGVVHAALLELFKHKIPPKSTGRDELVEKHDALILRFLDALLKVTRLAWERPMVVSILTLRLAMLPHSAMPEGQHPRVDGLDVNNVVAKARSDEMLARPMSLAYGNDVLSRCAATVVKMQQDEQNETVLAKLEKDFAAKPELTEVSITETTCGSSEPIRDLAVMCATIKQIINSSSAHYLERAAIETRTDALRSRMRISRVHSREVQGTVR